MTTNQYATSCADCGRLVVPGEGIVELVSRDADGTKSWSVKHTESWRCDPDLDAREARVAAFDAQIRAEFEQA